MTALNCQIIKFRLIAHLILVFIYKKSRRLLSFVLNSVNQRRRYGIDKQKTGTDPCLYHQATRWKDGRDGAT